MLVLQVLVLLTADPSANPPWQEAVLSDAPSVRARELAHLREQGKSGLYAVQNVVQKADDPARRARAIRALGELGEPEAEWQLRSELKQPAPHVVAAAVRAAQALKLQTLGRAVADRVGDPDIELCQALGAAAAVFPTVVDRAQAAFASGDRAQQLSGLRVLLAAVVKPPEAEVRQLALGSSGDLQFAATEALAQFDPDAAARVFAQLTTGSQANDAIGALGRLGTPAALGSLEELLSSPRYRAAAAALASSSAGEMRLLRRRASAQVSAQDIEVIDGLLDVQPRTPDLCVELLADADSEVAGFAAARLGRQPTGVAALVRCVETVAPGADRCARGLASSALAGDAVGHALGHLDPRVRQAMVRGLSAAAGPPTLAQLAPMAADASPEVRQALAAAFARLGQAGIPVLLSLASDREPDVRSAAAAQLMRVLPEGQLAQLAAQARHDVAIRSAVLAEIDRFSEEDAVRFLVACLHAPDSVERRQAIAALSRYRDSAATNALMDSAANDTDPALRELAVNVLAAQ